MLLVDLYGLDNLSVKFKYSRFYIDRIKKIPGAYFEKSSKSWIFPYSSLKEFEQTFEGEIVWRTPEWQIKSLPMPDMTSFYQVDQTITIPQFKIKPYDYQEFGIKFMIDRLNSTGFVFNTDVVGLGKCHGKGTEILMYSGKIKNAEDIQKGELIMGDDSTPRKVLSTVTGKEEMYRVTLRNGDSFTCNKSHILSLVMSDGNRYLHYRGGDIMNISVKDYLTLPDWVKRAFKAYKRPVSFQKQKNSPDFVIPPYLYGVWLGDGHSNIFGFTINDQDSEIVDYIKGYASCNNFEIRTVNERGCKTYFLHHGTLNSSQYPQRDFLKLSSTGGKHILREYLINSQENQLQLLAGLLDTDGHLVDNCYEIATKFKQLRDDILFLCRSLGFAVTHRIKVVEGVEYYRIFISGDTDRIPCITRKKASQRLQKKNVLRYAFTVEPIGYDDYYGFSLDGNHLYLLGDFTVTHNTVQALGTIAYAHNNLSVDRFMLLCKKSIKFQWKQEILKFTDLDKDLLIEYIPENATKKQREKIYERCNLHGKFILITTYQSSLYDKEEFKKLKPQMLVIDEAHILRNHTGKMNAAVRFYGKYAPYKVFLTGTPLMTKPVDIFGLMKIADKDYLGPWKEFEKEHILYEWKGSFQDEIGYRNLDVLRDKVQSVLIRRTENEVSLQMPSVIHKIVNVLKDKTQEVLSEVLEKKKEEFKVSLDQLEAQKLSTKDPSRILSLDARILQIESSTKGLIASDQAIADDPRLFLSTKSKMITDLFAPCIPKDYTGSPKTEAILDQLEEILDQSEKVIVFTKYVRYVELLADDIQKKLKVVPLCYHGQMKGDERIDAIQKFTQDPAGDYPIILMTDAGSEGLNLQAARHQINADLPDSPAIKTQRMGRIRRASSSYTKTYTYDFITDRSFDMEKLKTLERASNVFDSLVEIDEAQSLALKNLNTAK